MNRIAHTVFAFLMTITGMTLSAQTPEFSQKLAGIERTIDKILKDWNVPGCGVGIVVKDKLVFAKGFGYRDLEKKLPVTPNTLFQIASNTKLFTATAVGLLVDEGKLDWDKPVQNFVPTIRFYSDELTGQVTLRDMLSHRTGISRHDNIWYKSDFSRQELFDRLKYLEPSIPLRTGYLYNNLMYAAAGSVVEYISHQTWEEFVTSRLFNPLGMNHSLFVTGEMLKQPDFMTPYYEKRDTTVMIPYPFYSQFQGVGPCGSIISSINDLSSWLIAQINGGRFKGVQVIPASVVRETLQPASITSGVPDKNFEYLNSMYGMGRGSSGYKGHYRTQHGGAIGGIYSNVSFMLPDSVGIIVFTNGAHAGQLPGIIASTLYDEILGLEPTPWSDRALKDFLRSKAAEREARKKPEADRIPDTRPSHPLNDFAGTFEHPAYGVLEIIFQQDQLSFSFHHTTLPLKHYHYDRFVSPDDVIAGLWSFVYDTDAQGRIYQIRTSLDEKEVIFSRKADARLSDPSLLRKLAGSYERNGSILVVSISNGQLLLATAPPQHLDPYMGNSYKIREFPDQQVEFVLDHAGQANALKVISDGKNYAYARKK